MLLSPTTAQAFIFETMRLFYVVPCGVPHGTTRRGARLESWALPEDCLIIPLNYHILRDEQLWHRPDEFNPKRFIGADGRVEVPDHFLPFQVGQLNQQQNKQATLHHVHSIILGCPRLSRTSGLAGFTLRRSGVRTRSP